MQKLDITQEMTVITAHSFLCFSLELQRPVIMPFSVNAHYINGRHLENKQKREIENLK